MTFNESDYETKMLQKLVIVAKEFMDTMAKKVRQNRLPSAINQHTRAESPKKEGNTLSIDIVIDTKDGAAPMAGAFEWGSGLHSTKGEKDTYLIEPRKSGGKLVIPRERWPKYQPPPDKDPIFLKWAYHPGVEARPYIKPSIEESKEKILKTLGQGFKAQILSQTPKVTIIDAEK